MNAPNDSGADSLLPYIMRVSVPRGECDDSGRREENGGCSFIHVS